MSPLQRQSGAGNAVPLRRGAAALTALGATWWPLLVALCALLLSRVGLQTRAYCLVFGHDWVVVSNGGFCHLRLAPRR